ncbi:MAG: glycosyltransferase family 2 protein [Kiritimatiellae bacterium]|nr:glycosyltransferase family 2 protein [Kiritimatiellia bacterium]
MNANLEPNPVTNEFLSVIVPAYNERDCVASLVKAAHAALQTIAPSFEIVIVDDGSTDGTTEIADTLAAELPSVRTIHQPNRGMGNAILTGLREVRGELVTFMPADGQFAPADIAVYLRKIQDADVVVGRRQNRRGVSLYRRVVSRIFMLAVRLMFHLPVRDVNWVHLYRRQVLAGLQIQSQGVFFLGEIVVRTHHAGFRIVDVPVGFLSRAGGQAKNCRPKVILQTVREMFRVWRECRKQA